VLADCMSINGKAHGPAFSIKVNSRTSCNP
jgi:hypothetical protein